jgi:hypothetical protein
MVVLQPDVHNPECISIITTDDDIKCSILYADVVIMYII